MHLLSWLFSFIALYGTWLNLKQDRQGFYYWVISNTGFAIISFLTGQYALMLLFGTYLILAVKGISEWK